MSKRRNEETGAVFDVGYARPPKDWQFQKGQSGNPSGRRKNAEQKRVVAPDTIISLIAKEGQRLITGTENGKTFKAPTLQVLIRRIHNRALNGDMNAAKLALAMNERPNGKIRPWRKRPILR